MQRPHVLSSGEHYHVFNRGAGKQAIFMDDYDRDRFLVLLYLANDTGPLHMANVLSKYKGRSFMDVYEELPDRTLVDVHAYSLMTNHFHIVLKQKTENGITAFMKKLSTSYSMYYNAKHSHSGTLFQGRFQSRHIENEPYFRWIYSYVHLNPAEHIAPDWEIRGIENPDNVRAYLNAYKYSSFIDYRGSSRTQGKILSMDSAPAFLSEQNDLEDLLANIKDRPL